MAEMLHSYEKDEAHARRDRIDIEPITTKQSGESRDIEWRCGGPEDGRQKRYRDFEPENRRKGDTGRTYRDQRPEEQPLSQFLPGPRDNRDQKYDERDPKGGPQDHQ
jgi:hypothetical protein